MPSTPRRLVVIGDSLFAEIALEYFTHDSEYDVVGFAVEKAYRKQDTFHGLPVHGFETLEEHVEGGEHSVFAPLVNDISIGRDNWIGPQVTVMKSTKDNQFWLPPRSTLRETTPRAAFGVDDA